MTREFVRRRTESATRSLRSVTAQVSIDVWRGSSAVDLVKALPLRQGDQVRVSASLSTPMYCYLLWIGADGSSAAVYPWTDGRWDVPPELQQTSFVTLPERIDQGWPLRGKSGLETVVVGVTTRALSSDKDILRQFGQFPPIDIKGRILARSENGRVTYDVNDPERGPDTQRASAISDPVLERVRILNERVGESFDGVWTLSYSFLGGDSK